MSFGFSIGDFIAIADKALQVYKKCKSASGDYAALAANVYILHGVLDNTRVFLQEEQVPTSDRKMVSLIVAREGCRNTLDEVEEFLDKYSSLGRNQKRFIELVKFISKDVDGLKNKLKNNTELLQISLVSLSSLSISQVKSSLNSILEEYRSGARQPTVLSHAIIDNKRVDEKELLEQVTADLEDKDVHPDSITLNRPFIQLWLSKVVSEGGLDELPPGPSADPALEAAPLPIRGGIHDARGVDSSNENDPGRDVDDLYARSNNELEIPNADDLDNPPSRPESASSHQSKPDEWHPSDRPDPEYVQRMLAPFFQGDPFEPYDSGAALHRIKRAFHQQDWSDRGYLTRKEVLTLCQDALARAEVHQDVGHLQGIISAFDANKDGQFDELEFISLMHELIESTATTRKKQLVTTLHKWGEEARKVADSRRNIDSKPLLPWGWSRNGTGSQSGYFDEIAATNKDWPPAQRLHRSTFSMMALEADHCVEKIADFENKWLGLAPKDLQGQLFSVLNAVRHSALEYTSFENQENRFQLSDLDSILVTYHLVNNSVGGKEILASYKEIFDRLVSAKRTSYGLLQQIQGFVFLLATSETFRMNATMQNFPQFLAKWRSSQIRSHAKQIGLDMEQWGSVKEAVLACRKGDLLSTLEPQAIAIAKEYHSGRLERRKLLEGCPWTGKIVAATLSGWRSHKLFSNPPVYLRIELGNPKKTQNTTAIKRATDMTWQEEIPIELSGDPTIQVSIVYPAPKPNTQEDIVKYTFPEGSWRFDSLKSSYREPGRYTLVNDGLCELKLTLEMDDQNDIAEELKSLRRVDWMDLVADSYLFSDLSEEDNTLPPRWEARKSPVGRIYYVDHKNQRTTWLHPRDLPSIFTD